MMPTLKLTVKYANGADSIVLVRPRTQIAFEKKFDIAVGEAFDGSPTFRFEHVYFLAWHALKSSVPFEEWSDSDDLIGIEMEAEGTTDPTLPAPSDGS